MSDILCPVCNHSINQHKAPEDKTPGTYCPCRQSAADIALYWIGRTVHDLEAKQYETVAP